MNRVLIVCGRRLLARRPFKYAIAAASVAPPASIRMTLLDTNADAGFVAGGTSAVGWGVSGDKPAGRRPGS